MKFTDQRHMLRKRQRPNQRNTVCFLSAPSLTTTLIKAYLLQFLFPITSHIHSTKSMKQTKRQIHSWKRLNKAPELQSNVAGMLELFK
jgi:hypothetical protein